MARLGVMVTVILKGYQILSDQDEDISGILESALESESVKFIKNAEITEIVLKGRIKSVYYKTAYRPFEKLQNQAGINTVDSFIHTDEKLRTDCKKISAVGDVNGKNLFTHTAGAEASYIIRTLEFKKAGRFSYADVPWCIYTDPGIASIGYNVKLAERAGLDFRIS